MELLLQNCTNVICQEVEMGLKQAEVAKSYGLAIRSAAAGVDKPDWEKINTAILSRWSMSGLERIKASAMKIARSG